MSKTKTPKTPENCKNKYAYVEMVLNNKAQCEVISGLLVMVFKKSGGNYVVLKCNDESVIVLNTEFYNIMSIEYMDDVNKNMLFLTCEDIDQNEGINLLETLYDEFISYGFAEKENSPTIDTNKYINVPKDYINGTTSVINNSNDNKSSKSFSNNNTSYNNTSKFNKSVTTYKSKPKPKPTKFNRTKTECPTEEVLSLMINKLDQIKNGTFKSDLPETLGAVKTDDNNSTDALYDSYGVCGY